MPGSPMSGSDASSASAINSTGFSEVEIKETENVLELLDTHHFSADRVPSKLQWLSKLLIKLPAGLAGLGYWGVVQKYNKDKDVSDTLSDINIIAVTLSSGFVLLLSVDLAYYLVGNMLGNTHPDLKPILSLPTERESRLTRFKIEFGSFLSGFCFLIIALYNPLPPVADMTSSLGKNIAEGIWAAFFFIANWALHRLPVAVLLSPAFQYYLIPITFLPTVVKKCAKLCRKKNSDMENWENEIKSLQEELEKHYQEIISTIDSRLNSSLQQFVTQYNQDTFTQLEEKEGYTKRLFLLQEFPPQPLSKPLYSQNTARILRAFGAHIQIIGNFVFISNVFPTLYNILINSIDASATTFLSGILGMWPATLIFVILSYFGELQFPRLVDYVINLGKKCLGIGGITSLLHPAAKFNYTTFTLFLGFNIFISISAPINAISVTEQQYKDDFSSNVFSFFNFYSYFAVAQLTFIAFLDLYFNFQVEAYTSKIFGSENTQNQARLMQIQAAISFDTNRLDPNQLLNTLKNDSQENLNLLLGADKGNVWLDNQEQKIKTTTQKLTRKKQEHQNEDTQSSINLQNRNKKQQKDQNFFVKCMYRVFCCCSKKSNDGDEVDSPLLRGRSIQSARV